MSKLFIFIVLIFVSAQASENTEESELINNDIQRIDGRSQNLIDEEECSDPNSYLIKGDNKELFEIVNFRNISENKNDNIKNYRGKIIILHFWATWCGYCVEEMKLMDNLAAILKKKEIEDVVILPISVDNDDSSIIKNFYRERNLTNIGMYQDKESKYMSLLRYSTLPLTVIVDRTGHQISLARGCVRWNNKSTIEYLEKLR